MNKQQIAKLFDTKNIAAVELLAGNDSDTVLATWYKMLTLAINDPEGCVRLAPKVQMDLAELAAYFHRPPEVVEVTAQVLEQMQQLTREEDGTLKLIACAGLHRRGKNKKSVAANFAATKKETEKEKRKEPKEKSKEKNKKADIADAISKVARAPEKQRPEKAKDKNTNQPETEAAVQNAESTDQTGQSPKRNKNRIPLNKLPEPEQHILNAWNALPLDDNFDGLYPAMLKQLQILLERYGEEALLKAIDNVAHSSFLLGKTRNSRGWFITLGWMLVPEHLENILQGKYRDKKPRSQSLLFQPGDEEAPYSNGFYGTVVD